MPHSVIYKAKANQDLNDIFTFILTQGGSADRAFNFVERIRAFCDSFASFPYRGTKRDDLRSGLRFTGFERRVAIAFTIENDLIVIIRIFYAGRDIDVLGNEENFTES